LILSLAQYPVVQQELKLTDPQKTKIRSVVELSTKRQSELRDQMNPPGQAGQGGGQGGNGGGGPGGQANARAEMAARFAAMNEGRMVLDQDIEKALASILDRGQYGRLKQIQLQVEGISALGRPDIIEKLNLDEFQVEQIRELLNQSNQAQRESSKVMFDMIRTGLPNSTKNGPNPGGPDLRDPAVQEAMKAFMAKPEVRAKMTEMHAQSTKMQGQLLNVVVSRVFGKRQAATYRKMLGAPLNLSGNRGGPGQAPGNRPPGENQSDRANAAGKAEASDSDDDEAATSIKPAPKSKDTDAKAKAKPKSLRELRGGDD
jgi:hypothetical protein